MAVGNSGIAAMRTFIDEIDRVCKNEFPDQLNTFNYVVNNIRTWAEETDIGEDLRQNLSRVNQGIEQLVNSTKMISEHITSFVETQSKLNSLSE